MLSSRRRKELMQPAGRKQDDYGNLADFWVKGR